MVIFDYLPSQDIGAERPAPCEIKAQSETPAAEWSQAAFSSPLATLNSSIVHTLFFVTKTVFLIFELQLEALQLKSFFLHVGSKFLRDENQQQQQGHGNQLQIY